MKTITVPSFSLLLALLMLGGCSRYPSDLYECRIGASKAPTILGVNTALDACETKFKEESEKEAKEAAARAAKAK